MTKDADTMICCLYKEYLERVKIGSPKKDSRKFKPEYFSSNLPFSNWHSSDIDMTKSELVRLSYLKADIIGNISFTDDGISYMENRFKNNLKELCECISKLTNLVSYTL